MLNIISSIFMFSFGDQISSKYNGVVPQATTCDWSVTGAVVNPPQDQGYCGSCYSFAGKGAVEGRRFVTGGNAVDLSAQQIFDGTGGSCDCGGVAGSTVFKFIQTNKGLCSNIDYPYSRVTYLGWGGSLSPPTCANIPGTTVASYSQVYVCDQEGLKRAVKIQPIYITS